MEKEREFVFHNGPQRHPWIGAIFMHYFHPGIEDNPDFPRAIKEIYELDRNLHCVRQVFALDCDKDRARSWLSKRHLSKAVFDIFQAPAQNQAAKVTTIRGFFPGALVVFVSQFVEHMNVGADVHVGIADSHIKFGNKGKNFVKKVQLSDLADICLDSYLRLSNLAKYPLLVDSLRDRTLVIGDILRKRQVKLLQRQSKEA